MAFTRNGSLAPAYTNNGLHHGPNPMGLNLSGALASQATDTAGHRLLASDSTNHRVPVFNLTTDNLIIDHAPDAVQGKADFTSRAAAAAQNRFNSPCRLEHHLAAP